MIKSSKITFKFARKGKINNLNVIIDEYSIIVRSFIDRRTVEQDCIVNLGDNKIHYTGSIAKLVK